MSLEGGDQRRFIPPAMRFYGSAEEHRTGLEFKSKFGEHTDGIAVSQQQTTIALTDAVIKLGEAVVQPPAAGGSRSAHMRVTSVQHVAGDNRSAARFRCRESRVIAQSLVLTQPDDNRGVQVLKSRVKR